MGVKRWLGAFAVFVVAAGVVLGWHFLGGKQIFFLNAVPRFALSRPFVVACVENPDKILERLRRIQGMPVFTGLADVSWPLLGAMEKGVFFADFEPGATFGGGKARTYGFSIIPKSDFLDQLKRGVFSGTWGDFRIEPAPTPLEGTIDEADGGKVRKLILPSDIELYYVLRERGREDTLFLASPSPDTLRSMVDALRSKEKRFAVERKNSGPDFAILRFPVVVGANAMAQSEFAWLEDDTAGHLQIYSDYARVVGKNGLSQKSGVKGDDLPLLGGGELAFVAAVDVPFFASLFFPGAPDPVDSLLSRFEKLVPWVGGDRGRALKNALEKGRISIVCTTPSFMYGVIESNDEAALDDLYAALSSEMNELRADGWTKAATRKGLMATEFVLARRKKILLFGLGSPNDLAQKATIPESLKELPAPKDFIDVIASAKMFRAFVPASSVFLPSWLEKWLLEAAGLVEKMEEKRTLNFIHLRVITPEKADLGIYFERGGVLTK